MPRPPRHLLHATAILALALAQRITPAVAPPMPCCPVTTSLFSTTASIAIPDNGSAMTTITVAGAGAWLWDIDLTMLLTHAFSSDLTITLRSPLGTFVTITSGNGTSSANVFNGTIWDDSAGAAPASFAVTDVPLPPNTPPPRLVPEEAMGAFVGQNPNGAWLLTLSDTSAGATGSLAGASLAITTCAAAPSVMTQTFSSSTPRPIVDSATATSTIPVGGARGAITRLTVTTMIRHTACGQLIITVRSPQGSVVTLSSGNGGTNNDVFNGTVWRDDAGVINPPGAVTDSVLINGVVATPLCPEEALGGLYGEDPNGVWTLSITDTGPGDTGALDGWSITFDACGPRRCLSDLDHDGIVNSTDIGFILGAWGPCPP